METYIETLKVIGLHKRFDIEQSFKPGLNILYGENGSFKTTLLNILANLLNDEIEKFIHLDFIEASIRMSDGIETSVRWKNKARGVLIASRTDQKRSTFSEVTVSTGKPPVRNNYNNNPLPKAIYFPTSRATVDIFFMNIYGSDDDDASNISNKEISIFNKRANSFLRKALSEFHPSVNFFSMPEILNELSRNINHFSGSMISFEKDFMAESLHDLIKLLSLKDNSFENNLNRSKQANSADLEELESYLRKVEARVKNIQIYPFHSEGSIILSSVLPAIRDMQEREYNEDTSIICRAVEILKVYEKILSSVQEFLTNNFQHILDYVDSLNFFLRAKKLRIANERKNTHPYLILEFDISEADDEVEEQEQNKYTDYTGEVAAESVEEIPEISYREDLEQQGLVVVDDLNLKEIIHIFSSGERQIASLIYSSKISREKVVLLDEPEISLHVNWQEDLLEHMQSRFRDKQMIICTHSPMIGANHIDAVQTINIIETNTDGWNYGPQPDLPPEEESEVFDFEPYDSGE